MNVHQPLTINAERLLETIFELGKTGRNEQGELIRLAGSEADKAGRDLVLQWLREANLEVEIDQIGNIYGIWRDRAIHPNENPLLIGSHIDTVINAGIYDGSYGVLAGLEIIKTLQETDVTPWRPIAIVAFTNEEGVRYAPDMMGSLVTVGGLSIEQALETVGIDETIFGEELEKIGYAGERKPGFLQPHAYIELHIEQGPILEKTDQTIGAVENLQGISWQKLTIEGVANHAGTTPMNMRQDAGQVASRIMSFVYDHVKQNSSTVVTVGSIEFEPNLINVIPARATFTVDLRDPNEDILREAEESLGEFVQAIAKRENVTITSEKLARFEPVNFSEEIVQAIEDAANNRQLKNRRMTSGAGHDAQMMARICPTAMIFVPSKDGISHNPKEFTPEEDLVAGANVLLDVVHQFVQK